MRRLASLLIVLSVCTIAWAEYCPPSSPIHLYSDQSLDLQVFFDNRPAAAAPVRLYAADKLVHSAIADQSGRVSFVLLPDHKYRVVTPHNGALDVVVLPQRSNLNGPLISWFLFPTSTYKWVAGKKVTDNPCPIIGPKSRLADATESAIRAEMLLPRSRPPHNHDERAKRSR